MTTLAPIPLSGSTHGRPIKITTTTSTGDLIHTANSSSTLVDLISLEVQNSHSAPVTVTVAWGGTSNPDDLMTVTIPNNAGWVPIEEKAILRNSLVVRMWATVANVVTVKGVVWHES